MFAAALNDYLYNIKQAPRSTIYLALSTWSRMRRCICTYFLQDSSGPFAVRASARELTVPQSAGRITTNGRGKYICFDMRPFRLWMLMKRLQSNHSGDKGDLLGVGSRGV